MKIRNINPLGRVDVPLLRRQGDIEGEGRGCLEPGEVITVTAAIGAALLEQTTNFEAVEQGVGLRVGSRVARSGRRVVASAEGSGDLTIGAALLEQTTNFEAVEMASPAQVEEPTS